MPDIDRVRIMTYLLCKENECSKRPQIEEPLGH